MHSIKKILLIAMVFIFTGCASVMNYTQIKHVPRDGYIAVLPLQNNTNTPRAGQRAKNIIVNILLSRNYPATGVSAGDEEYMSEKRANEISKNLNSKYYLFGSVNEWRYKSGMEAEPAVAVSFRIIDKKSGAVVYSAVGAKNGWGGDSVSSIAQKLVLELINER